jgi:thymidylate kinase
VAYGEAQGLDPQWLTDIQKYLPAPVLTVFLDISPATAVERKTTDRDRYERDLAMQERVRVSYARQAAAPGWVTVDGERPKPVIAADVLAAVSRVIQP